MRRVQSIHISEDFGSVEGYVADTAAEQMHNWLTDERAQPEELTAKLRLKYAQFAALKNLYVNEEQRHQGHGTNLLQRFLDEAFKHGAEVVVAIADTGEIQLPGFSLLQWYVTFGFTPIGVTLSGPLLALEPL